MQPIEKIKFTKEERRLMLGIYTQGLIPGSVVRVIKVNEKYQLHILYNNVEDLIPVPKTIEEYERAMHQFLRWAAKWQRRGMRITLETWKTIRPEDGI